MFLSIGLPLEAYIYLQKRGGPALVGSLGSLACDVSIFSVNTGVQFRRAWMCGWNTTTSTVNLTFFYYASYLPPPKTTVKNVPPSPMVWCCIISHCTNFVHCSRGHLLERMVVGGFLVGGFLMAGSCLHLYFPTTSVLELSSDSAFHVCWMPGSRASCLVCRINATRWWCARCPTVKGNHWSREVRGIAVVFLAFFLNHSFLFLCPVV